MKIITGEQAPTKGQVKICGYNVTNNQSDAFKLLGYCPQVS
jgi:ABC-type multidrug transport system ATPase subunit